MRFGIAHLFVGLLVVVSSPAMTATKTSITGRVVTEDREGLSGITVALTAPHLETERSTITDEQGRFRFAALPAGEYTLEAQADGFQMSTKTVSASVGASSDVTVTLYPRLGPMTEKPFTIVRVHYGTNRTRVRDTTLGANYNARIGPLSLGSVTVSIPRDHRLGDWEQALTPGTARQAQHVILLSVMPRTKDSFVAAVRDRVGRSAKREAFVFVHGYNTSFADAVTRTALLAYDLKFDGAPITFTWPSRAAFWRYPADEETAQASVEYLEEFLTIIGRESGASRIHLIAHSMGNRVLLEALRSLQQRNQAPSNLAHLVLTAPDVNVVRFAQLVPRIRTLAERTTLYASAKDKALRASKFFHGYQRAGEAGKTLTVLDGVDTVDVTAVDTSFIAHTYFGDNRSVITDLYDLIRNGTPPAARLCLSGQPPETPRWWTFDSCRP